MKIGEGEKGVEVRGGKGGREQKQKRKHSVDNLLFVYVCLFVCLFVIGFHVIMYFSVEF